LAEELGPIGGFCSLHFIEGIFIMDSVIEKAQKVASGILRAIPMAPVSKHIATWVDDVDIREFQTYHDVGVGLEVTEDGRHIVARKRPKSSSW
jgi:hypothetical protein